uniref:Methyltransf_FA domain-containing protein n=1 Tax=Anopheles maculatus TaxID=74869 RepID=A0A182SFZ2_9DIPT
MKTLKKIQGCKQHNGVIGYHSPVQYFPTANMQHVGHTGHSKQFKIAILGPSDGHIRFGKSVFPYNSDVIEIVLGGWGNTKSAGRRQHRTASNRLTNQVLAEAQTPNLMSPYRPVVFVLEVFNDGRVEVRLHGQTIPFLTFTDNNRTPVNYMAFTRWEKDLIFFYDCPL